MYKQASSTRFKELKDHLFSYSARHDNQYKHHLVTSLEESPSHNTSESEAFLIDSRQRLDVRELEAFLKQETGADVSVQAHTLLVHVRRSECSKRWYWSDWVLFAGSVVLLTAGVAGAGHHFYSLYQATQ